MIALLLSLSPVPPFVSTIETETEPRLTYSCSMVDERQSRHSLRFHTEGGRGYLDSNGNPVSTPVRYVFDQDGTGRLAKLPQTRLLSDARGAVFSSDQLAAELREVTPFMKDFEGGWKASLVLTFDHGLQVERMVGFCDVRTIEQKPLSAAEARRVAR